MNKIRSIPDLLQLIESFIVDRNRNELKCVPCFSTGCQIAVFKYAFEGREDFTHQNMTYEFSTLKSHVVRHIYESIHHERLTSPQADYRPTKEERETGLIIGRRILSMAKLGIHHLKLKNELHLLALASVQIGSINHSPYVLRSLLPRLYECEVENIAKQINGINPITKTTNFYTLTADKVSLNHRTFHVFVLYFLRKDRIQPIFLKVAENEGGSGPTLAQEIVQATIDTLGCSKEDMKKR